MAKTSAITEMTPGMPKRLRSESIENLFSLSREPLCWPLPLAASARLGCPYVPDVRFGWLYRCRSQQKTQLDVNTLVRVCQDTHVVLLRKCAICRHFLAKFMCEI